MSEIRKIEFVGATGANLAARLDLPAKPRAFALFAHSSMLTEPGRLNNWISRRSVRQ